MRKWIIAIGITFVLWSQFDQLKKPIEATLILIALGLVLSRFSTVKEQFKQYTQPKKESAVQAGKLAAQEYITESKWMLESPLAEKKYPGGFAGTGSSRSW